MKTLELLSRIEDEYSARGYLGITTLQMIRGAIEELQQARTAPVNVPGGLRTEIEKLTHWKHCMSYNDSYFGEPAGLIKRVAYQLDRLISAAPSAPIAANSDDAGWISVMDGLPEVGQTVLAYRPLAKESNDPEIVIRDYSGVERLSPQFVKHGFECWCHPTHWMPLPPAPVAATAQQKASDHE